MIPSEQLRAGLITIEEAKGKGKLHVPHYWALYIHDGRGPSPGAGGGDKILVWFKDPKNDPRYPGGVYPVRLSQVKRLTKAQFRKWSRINRAIIGRYKQQSGKRILTASDYRAMDLPMIIAKSSPGDRSGVKSVPFFSNAPGGGMAGFKGRAGSIAKRETSKFVTDTLQRQGLLHKTVTRNINL